MKVISFLIFLLISSSLSCAYSKEVNCLIRDKMTFCEDERILQVFSKKKEQILGTIIKIDGLKTLHVLFDDGQSKSVPFNSGTYISNNKLKNCHSFNNLEVCIGDTVPVMGFGILSGDIGIMKVVAIGPHPLDVDPLKNSKVYGASLYGEIIELDGNISIDNAQTVLLGAGKTPFFEHLNLGDKVENAFGSLDTIKYYNPSSKHYAIIKGENTDGYYWLNKEKLAFRLSKKLEVQISLTRNGDETIDDYSRKDAYKKLKWRTKLFLESKCEDLYFSYGHAKLKNIKATIKNYDHKLEFFKFIGMGHGGSDIPWPDPRHKITGTVKMSATCSYK